MRKFKLSRFLKKEYLLYLLDKARKRSNVANGLIPYEPRGLDEIHYRGKEEVLGFAKTKLLPSAGWWSFRSAGELQKRNNQDKLACVTFSAHNAIEQIINLFWHLDQNGQANEEQKEIVKVFLYFGLIKDGQANVSERYIAKLSGTTYRGNTQKNVADAIHKFGLVPEELWSWVDDWDEYYKPVPAEIVEQGKKLIDYIEINYEWANPSLFNDSIQYAPLQTSGYAWPLPINGVYPRSDVAKNHAFVRDGKESRNIIMNYRISDSYEPFDKRLAADYNFGWDLIFTIHLKKNLSTNLWNMSNVKILKDKNSAQVGFYLPQTNESAMISVAKNFGIELPLNDKGELEWPEVKIDGEFELK